MKFEIESKYNIGDVFGRKDYEAKIIKIRLSDIREIEYLIEYSDEERHWIEEYVLTNEFTPKGVSK